MTETAFEWVQDLLSIAGNLAELVGLVILIKSLRSVPVKPSSRDKERSY